jgi:hypothetical protein
VARPVVPLLELVEERRFNANNKRHRAKLLEDDSLLEFVANNEAPVLWVMLADLQVRYRGSHWTLDRSWTANAAREFQSSLERLDEDAQPLELLVL